MNPIEIRNLYFKYERNSRYILEDVNLDVYRGETIILTGLSGSGKSTLLNIISGIIPHIYKGDIKGEVRLFGEEVKLMKLSDISKRVGIVFQDPDTQLFSPTVEDELAFGPENLMVERQEIDKRIENALKIVNMEDYRFENPNNLSGGQKQLIAIASVLTMEPEFLLFDEIMSQIDDEGRKRIRKLILNLKEEGKTIVMVEHDFKNLDISDRVLELKNGSLREVKAGDIS